MLSPPSQARAWHMSLTPRFPPAFRGAVAEALVDAARVGTGDERLPPPHDLLSLSWQYLAADAVVESACGRLSRLPEGVPMHCFRLTTSAVMLTTPRCFAADLYFCVAIFLTSKEIACWQRCGSAFTVPPCCALEFRST